MPRLRQSLFWLYIHSNAKLSISSKTSANLWHSPSPEEKKKLFQTNWYDFHQIYTLTFMVESLEQSQPKFPLIISYFFLTPRWYLVPEFDSTLNSLWNASRSSSTPTIYTDINDRSLPASWFLVKQNDPDLLRLIISRFLEDKIFIPPFTKFILIPLGVTPPLINPHNYTLNPLNADPTSKKFIKGGHNILRSYATAVDF